MPDWNDGDVIRAVARLVTATGEDIENVFFYKCQFNYSVAEAICTSAVAARVDEMYDFIEPAIPSDVTFADIDIQNLTQGLVYAALPWPVQTSGGGTGDTMPEQVCGLVVGRTNQSHVVGRKFLGPFIEANNTDGTWQSGLVAALGSFAADYISAIALGSSGGLIPGAARIVNGVVTAFNFFLTQYTSNGVYTQRRRRRGVGS